MIKNLCKLFLFVILLSGSVFAQEYQTVRAEHILVKLLQRLKRLKKQLMMVVILSIMPELIHFAHQGETAEIWGIFHTDRWYLNLKKQHLKLL